MPTGIVDESFVSEPCPVCQDEFNAGDKFIQVPLRICRALENAMAIRVQTQSTERTLRHYLYIVLGSLFIC
eukprot:COSAG05_NODE_2374_length_3159_cov_2.026471_3_plen_71_part_00